jgi:hypothetical protein
MKVQILDAKIVSFLQKAEYHSLLYPQNSDKIKFLLSNSNAILLKISYNKEPAGWISTMPALI